MKNSDKKKSNTKVKIDSFKDLGRLSKPCMRELLKHLFLRDVSVALMGADRGVRLNFFSNMSSNAVLKVRERILDCESRKCVKGMQDYITKRVNYLAETGVIRISFRRGKFKQNIPTCPLYSLFKLKKQLAVIFKHTRASDLSDDKLISALTIMGEINKRYGVPAMEDLKTGYPLLDEPLLKEGLSLWMDGNEPKVIEEILNTMNKGMVSEIEKRQNIIIRFIRSIQDCERPEILNRICNAI